MQETDVIKPSRDGFVSKRKEKDSVDRINFDNSTCTVGLYFLSNLIITSRNISFKRDTVACAVASVQKVDLRVPNGF